jgi:hypothetical protein
MLLQQVRRSQAQIDMPIVLEAMEKIKLGLRHQPLPPSDAKRRMASLLAARAVRTAHLCAILAILTMQRFTMHMAPNITRMRTCEGAERLVTYQD